MIILIVKMKLSTHGTNTEQDSDSDVDELHQDEPLEPEMAEQLELARVELEEEDAILQMDQQQSSQSAVMSTKGQYFFKKNIYKWAKTPPLSGKTRVENIIRIPAVIGEARINRLSKPIDA
jgi:hypothetical protein